MVEELASPSGSLARPWWWRPVNRANIFLGLVLGTSGDRESYQNDRQANNSVGRFA
jgi:hypothetical protein